VEETGTSGYLSDSSVESVSLTQSGSSSVSGSRRTKSKSLKERLEALQSSVLVLDCVVERKTVNDLASSIVDGRYEEQKCRLQDCGVANCVYLVEGASLNPQGVRSRDKGHGASGSGAGGGTINTNSIITALAATQVTLPLLFTLLLIAARPWESPRGCAGWSPILASLTRRAGRSSCRRKFLHPST
jgi:hypothetical protein